MSSTERLEIIAQNVTLIHELIHSDGILESPINLDINGMKDIELTPLEWTGFDVAPRKLKITNTGCTVNLSASWMQERPYLSGGPLRGNYVFTQIHFHWGENDMNGSEHTVDGSRLPMELHAVHFKEDYDTLESALRRPDGVTILVYLFKLQNEPNQFMQEIVKHLPAIRAAHSSARIVPSKLTNILRPFTDDYFLYWGSMITINNLHTILWTICREPIGVSFGQRIIRLPKIAEFRNLTDGRGAPILSNIRSLKDGQKRSIFHVCPSGSLYASLLPIPRVLAHRDVNESTNSRNVSAA